jgi:hypothetical protein
MPLLWGIFVCGVDDLDENPHRHIAPQCATSGTAAKPAGAKQPSGWFDSSLPHRQINMPLLWGIFVCGMNDPDENPHRHIAPQ